MCELRYPVLVTPHCGVLHVTTAVEVPGHAGKWLKMAAVLDPHAPVRFTPGAPPTPASGAHRLCMVFEQIVQDQQADIDRSLDLIQREGFAAYEAAFAAQMKAG